MKHALIGVYDTQPVLISVYPDRKDANGAHSWQVQGGFQRDSYVVAFPGTERGVFIDVKTGNTVRPTRGALTEEAFEKYLASIWGHK